MNYKHGKRKTRLYRIWSNIKTRCLNPNDPHFVRWGARGITVCDEWKDDFQAFYDWAMANGYEDHLTIDRKENDKGYSPDNCRWVTIGEQNRNKRTGIMLTWDGKTHTTAEWARLLGLGKNTISTRYHKGWSTEECLFGRKKVVK